jgi:hypothetical protein
MSADSTRLVLTERQDWPALVAGAKPMLQHQNIINSWPKVWPNQNQVETVYVIETDLSLLPDDAAYDHEAFNDFIEAIRSYLAEHSSFDPLNSFRFAKKVRGNTIPKVTSASG